tara:strand:- start:396 stop:680 length:285 start_codon:yes stop_codon:yes gene_type:complete
MKSTLLIAGLLAISTTAWADGIPTPPEPPVEPPVTTPDPVAPPQTPDDSGHEFNDRAGCHDYFSLKLWRVVRCDDITVTVLPKGQIIFAPVVSP